jgi:hypothetical protein
MSQIGVAVIGCGVWGVNVTFRPMLHVDDITFTPN